MEDEAFQQMIHELDPSVKAELHDIYSQYEIGTSEEAQIVRDIDKYEMMLQAYQYELKHPNIILDEFYTASKAIKTTVV